MSNPVSFVEGYLDETVEGRGITYPSLPRWPSGKKWRREKKNDLLLNEQIDHREFHAAILSFLGLSAD